MKTRAEDQCRRIGRVQDVVAVSSDYVQVPAVHAEAAAADNADRGAEATGLSRTQALSESSFIVDLLIQVSQRDNLPLSCELEGLIEECEAAGLPLILQTVSLPKSQPLASFPTEPPVTHSVFVDESGSASFSEEAQPVLCLTGVLISDEQIPVFEAAVNGLLDRHNLPRETEIHAQPLLSHEGPLGASTPDERYEFLRKFIEIGMRHVVGVHYIGMLKPMVEQPFRKRLESLGMNAYTQNVLYFNVTLQAAAIREIAFAKYRYYFDRTDAYRKDIRRILRALNDEPNRGLRLTYPKVGAVIRAVFGSVVDKQFTPGGLRQHIAKLLLSDKRLKALSTVPWMQRESSDSLPDVFLEVGALGIRRRSGTTLPYSPEYDQDAFEEATAVFLVPAFRDAVALSAEA